MLTLPLGVRPANPTCGPRLHITDRGGFSVGMVEARVGLITRTGRITRVSAKSIWTEGRDGIERLHRAYDGRLPTLTRAAGGVR